MKESGSFIANAKKFYISWSIYTRRCMLVFMRPSNIEVGLCIARKDISSKLRILYPIRSAETVGEL